MAESTVILELSGLLKAGVPARAARNDLADRLGQLPPRKLAEFETVWALVSETGGSLATAMQGLSEALAADFKHESAMELAFAGPKATTKLVSWLPIFGLVAAQLVGLNPIGAIFTKALAIVSVIFGVTLLFASWRWARSIMIKASPKLGDPGLIFDCMRCAVEAGLPLATATKVTEAAFLSRLGELPSEEALMTIQALGERNREAGASLVRLLSSAATLNRETKRFEEAKVIEKLSVSLMIPLGLLTLPAFVCLAIVPIAISLLSTGQNL